MNKRLSVNWLISPKKCVDKITRVPFFDEALFAFYRNNIFVKLTISFILVFGNFCIFATNFK